MIILFLPLLSSISLHNYLFVVHIYCVLFQPCYAQSKINSVISTIYIYIIMKRFYNEPDILEITWETLWRHREHLMLAVITITWTWRKNEQEDIANESNIIPLSPPHYFFFSKNKKLIIRRWSYLWTSLIIMQGKKIWRGKWRAEKQDVNWINLQWEASNPRNTWEIYLLMSPLTKALPAFDASLKFKS